MSWQEKFKEPCLASGVVVVENGIEVCGLNRTKRCFAHDCVSYHYPTKPPVDRHKSKAMAKVGISQEQFEEEMNEEA
jgi:hypothetical protein